MGVQPNLARSSRWLAFSLLGLAVGWLIFAKAFAPGGWALLLSKKPGELPAPEQPMTFGKETPTAHGSDPFPGTRTESRKSKALNLSTAKRQRLPAEALTAAGLTEDDRPVAEASIAEAWEEMGRVVAERLKPEADPKAKDGEVSYFIPADKAAGDAVLIELRRKFRESFGRDAADKLLAAMDWQAYFAAFGQRNVKITPGENYISLFYSDPVSGHPIESTIVSRERFPDIFGNAIQLPASAASR